MTGWRADSPGRGTEARLHGLLWADRHRARDGGGRGARSNQRDHSRLPGHYGGNHAAHVTTAASAGSACAHQDAQVELEAVS